MQLTVTPVGQSIGACKCCGKPTKTLWGYIDIHEQTMAAYYVHWTIGSAHPTSNFDLIVGPCDDDADPKRRQLVSLLFQPSTSGGSFNIIDSESRPANDPELCGRALTRAEVVGTPLAKEVSELIDAIWLQDPRISEVKALNGDA